MPSSNYRTSGNQAQDPHKSNSALLSPSCFLDSVQKSAAVLLIFLQSKKMNCRVEIFLLPKDYSKLAQTHKFSSWNELDSAESWDPEPRDPWNGSANLNWAWL